MPLRLLGYMVAIWNKHLEQHPDTKRLPAILPLVLHHGEPTWTAATRLDEILELDEALLQSMRELVPNFRFLLDDISRAKDEEFRARAAEHTAFAQLALVCLSRTRRGESFSGELRRWWDMVRKVVDSPTGLAAAEALLSYISETSDTPPAEIARELGPVAEEAFMTTAQQLIAKGKAEGKAEMLVKQLRAKFKSAVTPEATERVYAADEEELNRWIERILSANKLDEVFEA